MQETDALARFGKVVAARRARLALTRFEVRDGGGPSDTTLGNIENDTLGRVPSPAVLRKLDQGLRWSKGSAADVLAGGDPVPLESLSNRNSRSSVAAAEPDAIVLPLDEINNLFGLHRQLNAAHESCRGADPPLEEFDQVVAGFNVFVSRVAGRYATAVLEQRGGPGKTLPPMAEMAFGHLLDRPAVDYDPVEREEQLYRRWLAGRHDDIDELMDARFQERWAKRE